MVPLKCLDTSMQRIEVSHHKWMEHGSDIMNAYKVTANNFPHNCFILGAVHQLCITSSGASTALRPYGKESQDDCCCAHLLAPKGVVCVDTPAVVHYAVILEGPFRFPEGYQRVSSVLFLYNAEGDLQKALTIQLHHWAAVSSSEIESGESGICFMKADHVLGNDDSHYLFRPLKGGKFQSSHNIRNGSIQLKDHFCLVCIAIKKTAAAHPSTCSYAIMCQKPIQDGIQKFRVCVTYGVPSWIEVCACVEHLYLVHIRIH